MTIKSGTFSSLNISPAGSGASESKTSTKAPSSKSASSRTSSRSRTARPAGSVAVPSIDVASESFSILKGTLSETIYTYDSTLYDTEITGSGITSAYPVIVGTFPLTNLFERGKKSNTGQIFDLQNDLKDQMIELSNSIVENYYSVNPTASSSLATIRDENNEKLQILVQNIPGIVGARQEIVESTRIPTRGDSEQQTVDVASQTTGADAAAALGIEIPETSPETGTFGNVLTEYSDDDVKKFDGSDTKSVVSSLEARLLGTETYTRNDQAKTARHYQLLKAALFHVIEGKKLNDVEESGLDSPYEDLQYYAVTDISDYTHDKVEMNENLTFAKATINYAAEMINRGYYGDGTRLIDYAGLNVDLSNYGISHAGVYRYDEGEYDEVSGTGGAYTYLYKKPSNFPGSQNSGVVAIKKSRVNSDFVYQSVVSLAADVMKSSGNFSTDSLPGSINPVSSTGMSIIPVQDTIGDLPRFVADSGEGRQFALLDYALAGDVGDLASPVSDVVLLGTTYLETVSDQISDIQSSLTTLVRDNKAVISNQCALTIFSVFYRNISSFLKNSVLGTDSNTSGWSAFRAATYFVAAHDDLAAARLFRGLLDNDSINYNYWLKYPDSSGDGELVTGEEGESGGIYRYKDLGPSTSLSLLPKEFGFLESAEAGDVPASLFSEGGSFSTIDNVISELSSIYPAIGTDSLLANKIRIAFYAIFLYFLRKIKIRVNSYLLSETDDSTGRTTYTFAGYLSWDRADVVFLADCLDSAFTATQVDDVTFTSFISATGGQSPDDDQKSAGESNFTAVRSPIKSALQAYQDIRSLIAYQKTVLGAQVNGISKIFNYYENLAEAYDGNSQRAANIAARYASIESSVELLYRSNRFQTLIPGTSISSIATRSSNYRSIVESAFKNLIPRSSNLNVCMVGIPYGHLEILRLAQDERTYYFGAKINADDVRTSSDDENNVAYQFNYLSSSDNLRPSLAGPYNVYIPEIYDDFNSTTIVESPSDNSISLIFAESDLTSLKIVTREESSSTFRTIDFPAMQVQAALQSYLEDVYGLYPRYAMTKAALRNTPYPEEVHADQALNAAGYSINTDNPDDLLLYARLRATIMMHRDFMTTKMIEEIEASPLFDKIVYILFNGDDLGNILTEVYAKVEV